MSQLEKAFLEYWQRLPLQQGESVPRRAAINPREITPLLPFILIQERIAHHVMMMRLTGTKVDVLLGRNLTGVNSYEVNEVGLHPWMDRVLDIILKTPCGMHTTSLLTMDDGATFDMDLFQLPMNNDRGETTFLAGLMSAEKVFRDIRGRGTGLLQVGVKHGRFVDLGFGAPDFEL